MYYYVLFVPDLLACVRRHVGGWRLRWVERRRHDRGLVAGAFFSHQLAPQEVARIHPWSSRLMWSGFSLSAASPLWQMAAVILHQRSES